MALVCTSCGSENSHGAKFCSECAAPIALKPRGLRRTVTILFADVSGSTRLGEQLDPESMRALMGRYFAEMHTVIERHGGTVEKFIGDAVMAVFGIPQLHEDDALRAVRASAEIRERLRRLNIELEADRGIAIRFRTGVNTGEVVAGDPADSQTLITGDAVNTAARLEQAAAPDEILIGPTTHQLVRDAVSVEPLAPLALKGKARPLPAYRLVSVTPGAAGHARRLDAPLVGREPELAALQQAFAATLAERRCRLVTLLGAAGVGKSRLLAEFGTLVADRATVLSGRSLPYGEGITYWPLAEVVRMAAAIDEADDRDAAMAKLRLVAAETADPELVAERIGLAIGLATGSAPAEEISWATRQLLEALAREVPLVIEFDDVQWADEAFLDLLEYIVSLTHDAPLLLVCPARPELLDRRPGWGSGLPQATSLRLEPLAAESAAQLIGHLPGGAALPEPLRARILDVAEGNPLFVEEMLGMLVDESHLTLADDGAWRTSSALAGVEVPPSIAALLAARLDQLPPGERSLAERASVMGKSFEQAALAELMPDGQRAALARDLLALVRKDLIRPDRSMLSAGDAYCFRHLLIRDAAYDAVSKSERADLHARFGDWLERVSGDRLEEYEEIIGYHLERAYSYHAELGLRDAASASLAERAAKRLASAGRRALNISGSVAAITLLERALALETEPSADRAETLIALGEAAGRAGRLAAGQPYIEEALGWASNSGNDIIEAVAKVALTSAGFNLDPRSVSSDDSAAVASAAAVLETAGLHREAAKAYRLIAIMHFDGSRHGEALHFAALAITQARLSQDRHQVAATLAFRASLWTSGPLPADAVIEAIEPLLPEVEGSGIPRSFMFFSLVELYGMTGRFDEAREAAALSRSIALDLGHVFEAAATSLASGPMERLAGNLEMAETELRADYETLMQAGERRLGSTTAGFLAHVLCDRNVIDEALTLTEQAEHISAEDDYLSQVLWRSARARALATRDPQQALGLAAEAVARAGAAGDPVFHGGSLLSLAEVHEAADRWPEALNAIQQAITLFQSKGATAYVEQAEERREKVLEGRDTASTEPDPAPT